MNIYVYICLILSHITISSCSGSSDNDNPKVNKMVILDIQTGNDTLGRIKIGLFGTIVPKTVQNFYELCQRPKGKGYKGSKFDPVNKDFMILGGCFAQNNGQGSSIYGETFEDENFKLKHFGAGWLSMSNRGVDTNGSQLFITLKQTDWLDGKHVVFGKVLEGMDVVRKIENIEVDYKYRPLIDVTISNCTAEEIDKPFAVSMNSAD